MAQSLSAIYIHLIFSTKNRAPSIATEDETDLHKYFIGTLSGIDCPGIASNGMSDHVHLLFRLGKQKTISDLVKEVKIASSNWLKNRGSRYAGFHWHSGYGAFSVSQSMVEQVVCYIAKQKRTSPHYYVSGRVSQFLEAL